MNYYGISTLASTGFKSLISPARSNHGSFNSALSVKLSTKMQKPNLQANQTKLSVLLKSLGQLQYARDCFQIRRTVLWTTVTKTQETLCTRSSSKSSCTNLREHTQIAPHLSSSPNFSGDCQTSICGSLRIPSSRLFRISLSASLLLERLLQLRLLHMSKLLLPEKLLLRMRINASNRPLCSLEINLLS